MIKYMLDTNICIYIIKQKPQNVIERFRQAQVSEIGVSSITLSELEYGVMKSAKPEQNKLALAQCSLDMLIAAHALSQNSVLITNNESEFKRVSNLKIENWAK
jgi:tRNA(fMet)-specific endonuclease VapC